MILWETEKKLLEKYLNDAKDGFQQLEATKNTVSDYKLKREGFILKITNLEKRLNLPQEQRYIFKQIFDDDKKFFQIVKKLETSNSAISSNTEDIEPNSSITSTMNTTSSTSNIQDSGITSTSIIQDSSITSPSNIQDSLITLTSNPTSSTSIIQDSSITPTSNTTKPTFKTILKTLMFSPLVVNIKYIIWILLVLVILYLFFSKQNLKSDYDAMIERAVEEARIREEQKKLREEQEKAEREKRKQILEDRIKEAKTIIREKTKRKLTEEKIEELNEAIKVAEEERKKILQKEAAEKERKRKEEEEQERLKEEEEERLKEEEKKKKVSALQIYMENDKKTINDITDLAILEFLGTTALTENSAIYKFFIQIGDDFKTKDEIIMEVHKTKTKFNLLLIYDKATGSNLDLKVEFKNIDFDFDKFTFDFENLQQLTKNIDSENLQQLTKNIDSEFDTKIKSVRDINYMNLKINQVIRTLRNQKKDISYEKIEKIKQHQQQIQINTEFDFGLFEANEKKFLNFVKTNTDTIKLSEEIRNDVKQIYNKNFSDTFLSFEDAIGKILDKHYEILRNKNIVRFFKTNIESFSNSLLGINNFQFKNFLPDALKETVRNAIKKVDGYGYLHEDEKKYTKDVINIKKKIASFLKDEKKLRAAIEKQIENLTEKIMEKIATKNEDRYYTTKDLNEENQEYDKEVDALVQKEFIKYLDEILPNAPTNKINLNQTASRYNETAFNRTALNETAFNRTALNETALTGI